MSQKIIIDQATEKDLRNFCLFLLCTCKISSTNLSSNIQKSCHACMHPFRVIKAALICPLLWPVVLECLTCSVCSGLRLLVRLLSGLGARVSDRGPSNAAPELWGHEGGTFVVASVDGWIYDKKNDNFDKKIDNQKTYDQTLMMLMSRFRNLLKFTLHAWRTLFPRHLLHGVPLAYSVLLWQATETGPPDCLQDSVRETKRLAEFLGVQDQTLCKAVADKCQFQNMQVDKQAYQSVTVKNTSIYRKGGSRFMVVFLNFWMVPGILSGFVE